MMLLTEKQFNDVCKFFGYTYKTEINHQSGYITIKIWLEVEDEVGEDKIIGYHKMIRGNDYNTEVGDILRGELIQEFNYLVVEDISNPTNKQNDKR